MKLDALKRRQAETPVNQNTGQAAATLSAFARAFAPIHPPNRPSATAAGFRLVVAK